MQELRRFRGRSRNSLGRDAFLQQELSQTSRGRCSATRRKRVTQTQPARSDRGGGNGAERTRGGHTAEGRYGGRGGTERRTNSYESEKEKRRGGKKYKNKRIKRSRIKETTNTVKMTESELITHTPTHQSNELNTAGTETANQRAVPGCDLCDITGVQDAAGGEGVGGEGGALTLTRIHCFIKKKIN